MMTKRLRGSVTSWLTADAGFGGDAQYYGSSGPSSTNGYLDAGTGQYAQPDNSYNPSELL